MRIEIKEFKEEPDAVVTRFYWKDIIDNEPNEGSQCLVLYRLASSDLNGSRSVIKLKEYHDGMFYPRLSCNEGFYSVAFTELDCYSDLIFNAFSGGVYDFR